MSHLMNILKAIFTIATILMVWSFSTLVAADQSTGKPSSLKKSALRTVNFSIQKELS